jgi:pimeloyl-ACP methyl ester carboxylesterase
MAIIEIAGVPHVYELTPPSPDPAAPVLIFIHGWLLSRNYWQPLIDKLTRHYQCLIYDLRGFGDSQLPKAERLADSADLEIERSAYSLVAYAEDLHLMLQKLEIQKAWLIGHSLGGSIALWGASCCGAKIEGVICLNSGGGIYIKEEFERFRSAGQQLVKNRPKWLCYLPLMDWLFARAMVARPLSRCWGRQRLIDFLRADYEAALGSLLDSTTEAEVHLLPQVVSRLSQPVYFIAGDKDSVMEPRYVRHLASFHSLFECKGNNVIEIADCGHLSMVEQPEAVADKILSILLAHQSDLARESENRRI